MEQTTSKVSSLKQLPLLLLYFGGRPEWSGSSAGPPSLGSLCGCSQRAGGLEAGWSGSQMAPLKGLVFGWGGGGQPGHGDLILKQVRFLHLAAGLQKEQEKPSPQRPTTFYASALSCSYCPLDQSKSHDQALVRGREKSPHLSTRGAAKYRAL